MYLGLLVVAGALLNLLLVAAVFIVRQIRHNPENLVASVARDDRAIDSMGKMRRGVVVPQYR